MGHPRDAQAHWEDVYRTNAVDEVSWYQDSADISLRLIGPRPGPSGTGRAVDVGAGTSPVLDALLAAGWGRVTALDVSATALDVIRHRVGEHDPRAAYAVSDVLAWQPDHHYDLWHDRAVLHFLTEPAERSAYVALAARTVAPGGALVLGCFAADGPTRCSGLPTVRRSADQLASEFGAHFTLETAQTETHHTPTGAAQAFTWVRLRRTTDTRRTP